MREMERWSHGVFKPLAMLSHVVADAAEDCHELLLRIDEKPVLAWAVAKDVRPAAWFRCYESPEAVFEMLTKFAEAAGLVAGLDAIKEAARNEQRWVLRLTRWHSRIWQGRGYKVERLLDRVCETYYRKHHLPRLKASIDEELPMPIEAVPVLSSEEFIFAISVAAPSWLRFQKLPWALFLEAVAGDAQAIKQLLEIDPVADQHPQLAATLFRIQQTDPVSFKLIQAVKGQNRKKPKSTEDIKVLVSGWLVKMSHLLQDVFSGELFIELRRRQTDYERQPELKLQIKKLRAEAKRHKLRSRVSARKVRELWNAYAEDAGCGLNDADLITAPDSVDRQIRRKASIWLELWKSDKSRAA